MTWDWGYAWDVLPELCRALLTTVEATILAFVVAACVGLVLAILRRSRSRVVSWPISLIVEFVRSTPLIVQLYLLFYVLPNYGLTFPALATGVLGLGLHYSTYAAEAYRAGIEGVPRGQWEAASALNMSPARTWVSVVIPQAVPRAVPALGNYLNAMFKDSALLSVITVIELLGRAQALGQQSFRYVEPFTIVGLLYLVVSVAGSQLLARTESS